MTRLVETHGQLPMSIAWSGQALLSAQLQHQFGLAREGRRAGRSLRAMAMVELAKAWAEPPTRQRWREGPKQVVAGIRGIKGQPDLPLPHGPQLPLAGSGT